MSLSGDYGVPLSANYITKQDMEVISIERSTYEVIGLPASLVEELLTSFKSVITKMKEMAK